MVTPPPSPVHVTLDGRKFTVRATRNGYMVVTERRKTSHDKWFMQQFYDHPLFHSKSGRKPVKIARRAMEAAGILCDPS